MNIITNIPCGADGTESAAAITNAQERRGASQLERLCRDYGYQMTIDENDCLQFISDCVDADDAGLNVKWQRVLTIRKTVCGRECWTAMLYVDRNPKFSLQVFGGLSRAKAVAFDAVLAWHRNAKTGKLTGAECAK